MKSAPCSSFSEAILPLSRAVKKVSAAAAEAWPTAVLLTRVCLDVVKCAPPTLRCTICDEEEGTSRNRDSISGAAAPAGSSMTAVETWCGGQEADMASRPRTRQGARSLNHR